MWTIFTLLTVFIVWRFKYAQAELRKFRDNKKEWEDLSDFVLGNSKSNILDRIYFPVSGVWLLWLVVLTIMYLP